MSTNNVDRARANAMRAGAELLVDHATDVGAKVGITPETAATEMLEVALAMAWAQVILFRGANDSPERRADAKRLMAKRMFEQVDVACEALKGGKYLEVKR